MAVLVVLWCLVAGVPVVALVVDRDSLDVLGDVAVVLVPAIVASVPSLARQVRATFAVFGLSICCELLVGYAGGAYDVDILLLLIVVVSALYRSWSPFLLTTGLVALHYGVYVIATASAIVDQPDMWERWTGIWTYTGLRGLFLVGAASLGLAGWRLDELSNQDRETGRTTSPQEPSDLTTVTGRLLTRKQAATRHVSGLLVDDLTGLLNRTGFMQALTHACQRSSGRGAVAVLLVDLDRFKVIKSSFGHEVADALLAEVGRRLRHQASADRAVARSMGDVFMMLIEDVPDIEWATRQAEIVVAAIAHPFELGGREVNTSASVGVAIAPYDAAPVAPVELLRRAEVGLYTAKSNGHSRVAAYDPSTDMMTPERMELEADLHHAIERRQLLVYYQPIVRLSDGQICGLEALLRWRHPRLGIVPPDRFIPIAEETGLIVPLGRWVLRQAAFQVAAWRRQLRGCEALGLSVNVSPVELGHARLLENVAATLADSGLPAGSLILEVTESALVGEGESQILTALCEQGVQLAIDDFGTGYSSLSYLHKLPAACLKIDRSFVAAMHDDQSNAPIVEAIVAIARSLRMRVVAEGIETTCQLKLLQEAGCEFGQGYLFSPPLPIADVERLIVASNEQRQGLAPASVLSAQSA